MAEEKDEESNAEGNEHPAHELVVVRKARSGTSRPLPVPAVTQQIIDIQRFIRNMRAMGLVERTGRDEHSTVATKFSFTSFKRYFATLSQQDKQFLRMQLFIWCPVIFRRLTMDDVQRALNQVKQQVYLSVCPFKVLGWNEDLSKSKAQRNLFRKEQRYNRSHNIPVYTSSVVPVCKRRGQPMTPTTSCNDLKLTSSNRGMRNLSSLTSPGRSGSCDDAPAPVTSTDWRSKLMESDNDPENMKSKLVKPDEPHKRDVTNDEDKSDNTVTEDENKSKTNKIPEWFLTMLKSEVVMDVHHVYPQEVLPRSEEVKSYVKSSRRLLMNILPHSQESQSEQGSLFICLREQERKLPDVDGNEQPTNPAQTLDHSMESSALCSRQKERDAASQTENWSPDRPASPVFEDNDNDGNIVLENSQLFDTLFPGERHLSFGHKWVSMQEKQSTVQMKYNSAWTSLKDRIKQACTFRDRSKSKSGADIIHEVRNGVLFEGPCSRATGSSKPCTAETCKWREVEKNWTDNKCDEYKSGSHNVTDSQDNARPPLPKEPAITQNSVKSVAEKLRRERYLCSSHSPALSAVRDFRNYGEEFIQGTSAFFSSEYIRGRGSRTVEERADDDTDDYTRPNLYCGLKTQSRRRRSALTVTDSLLPKSTNTNKNALASFLFPTTARNNSFTNDDHRPLQQRHLSSTKGKQDQAKRPKKKVRFLDVKDSITTALSSLNKSNSSLHDTDGGKKSAQNVRVDHVADSQEVCRPSSVKPRTRSPRTGRKSSNASLLAKDVKQALELDEKSSGAGSSSKESDMGLNKLFSDHSLGLDSRNKDNNIKTERDFGPESIVGAGDNVPFYDENLANRVRAASLGFVKRKKSSNSGSPSKRTPASESPSKRTPASGSPSKRTPTSAELSRLQREQAYIASRRCKLSTSVRQSLTDFVKEQWRSDSQTEPKNLTQDSVHPEPRPVMSSTEQAGSRRWVEPSPDSAYRKLYKKSKPTVHDKPSHSFQPTSGTTVTENVSHGQIEDDYETMCAQRRENYNELCRRLDRYYQSVSPEATGATQATLPQRSQLESDIWQTPGQNFRHTYTTPNVSESNRVSNAGTDGMPAGSASGSLNNSYRQNPARNPRMVRPQTSGDTKQQNTKIREVKDTQTSPPTTWLSESRFLSHSEHGPALKLTETDLQMLQSQLKRSLNNANDVDSENDIISSIDKLLGRLLKRDEEKQKAEDSSQGNKMKPSNSDSLSALMNTYGTLQLENRTTAENASIDPLQLTSARQSSNVASCGGRRSQDFSVNNVGDTPPNPRTSNNGTRRPTRGSSLLRGRENVTFAVSSSVFAADDNLEPASAEEERPASYSSDWGYFQHNTRDTHSSRSFQTGRQGTGSTLLQDVQLSTIDEATSSLSKNMSEKGATKATSTHTNSAKGRQSQEQSPPRQTIVSSSSLKLSQMSRQSPESAFVQDRQQQQQQQHSASMKASNPLSRTSSENFVASSMSTQGRWAGLTQSDNQEPPAQENFQQRFGSNFIQATRSPNFNRVSFSLSRNTFSNGAVPVSTLSASTSTTPATNQTAVRQSISSLQSPVTHRQVSGTTFAQDTRLPISEGVASSLSKRMSEIRSPTLAPAYTRSSSLIQSPNQTPTNQSGEAMAMLSSRRSVTDSSARFLSMSAQNVSATTPAMINEATSTSSFANRYLSGSLTRESSSRADTGINLPPRLSVALQESPRRSLTDRGSSLSSHTLGTQVSPTRLDYGRPQRSPYTDTPRQCGCLSYGTQNSQLQNSPQYNRFSFAPTRTDPSHTQQYERRNEPPVSHVYRFDNGSLHRSSSAERTSDIPRRLSPSPDVNAAPERHTCPSCESKYSLKPQRDFTVSSDRRAVLRCMSPCHARTGVLCNTMIQSSPTQRAESSYLQIQKSTSGKSCQGHSVQAANFPLRNHTRFCSPRRAESDQTMRTTEKINQKSSPTPEKYRRPCSCQGLESSAQSQKLPLPTTASPLPKPQDLQNLIDETDLMTLAYIKYLCNLKQADKHDAGDSERDCRTEGSTPRSSFIKTSTEKPCPCEKRNVCPCKDTPCLDYTVRPRTSDVVSTKCQRDTRNPSIAEFICKKEVDNRLLDPSKKLHDVELLLDMAKRERCGSPTKKSRGESLYPSCASKSPAKKSEECTSKVPLLQSQTYDRICKSYMSQSSRTGSQNADSHCGKHLPTSVLSSSRKPVEPECSWKQRVAASVQTCACICKPHGRCTCGTLSETSSHEYTPKRDLFCCTNRDEYRITKTMTSAGSSPLNRCGRQTMAQREICQEGDSAYKVFETATRAKSGSGQTDYCNKKLQVGKPTLCENVSTSIGTSFKDDKINCSTLLSKSRYTARTVKSSVLSREQNQTKDAVGQTDSCVDRLQRVKSMDECDKEFYRQKSSYRSVNQRHNGTDCQVEKKFPAEKCPADDKPECPCVTKKNQKDETAQDGWRQECEPPITSSQKQRVTAKPEETSDKAVATECTKGVSDSGSNEPHTRPIIHIKYKSKQSLGSRNQPLVTQCNTIQSMNDCLRAQISQILQKSRDLQLHARQLSKQCSEEKKGNRDETKESQDDSTGNDVEEIGDADHQTKNISLNRCANKNTNANSDGQCGLSEDKVLQQRSADDGNVSPITYQTMRNYNVGLKRVQQLDLTKIPPELGMVSFIIPSGNSSKSCSYKVNSMHLQSNRMAMDQTNPNFARAREVPSVEHRQEYISTNDHSGQQFVSLNGIENNLSWNALPSPLQETSLASKHGSQRYTYPKNVGYFLNDPSEEAFQYIDLNFPEISGIQSGRVNQFQCSVPESDEKGDTETCEIRSSELQSSNSHEAHPSHKYVAVVTNSSSLCQSSSKNNVQVNQPSLRHNKKPSCKKAQLFSGVPPNYLLPPTSSVNDFWSTAFTMGTPQQDGLAAARLRGWEEPDNATHCSDDQPTDPGSSTASCKPSIEDSLSSSLSDLTVVQKSSISDFSWRDVGQKVAVVKGVNKVSFMSNSDDSLLSNLMDVSDYSIPISNGISKKSASNLSVSHVYRSSISGGESSVFRLENKYTANSHGQAMSSVHDDLVNHSDAGEMINETGFDNTKETFVAIDKNVAIQTYIADFNMEQTGRRQNNGQQRCAWPERPTPASLDVEKCKDTYPNGNRQHGILPAIVNNHCATRKKQREAERMKRHEACRQESTLGTSEASSHGIEDLPLDSASQETVKKGYGRGGKEVKDVHDSATGLGKCSSAQSKSSVSSHDYVLYARHLPSIQDTTSLVETTENTESVFARENKASGSPPVCPDQNLASFKLQDKVDERCLVLSPEFRSKKSSQDVHYLQYQAAERKSPKEPAKQQEDGENDIVYWWNSPQCLTERAVLKEMTNSVSGASAALGSIDTCKEGRIYLPSITSANTSKRFRRQKKSPVALTENVYGKNVYSFQTSDTGTLYCGRRPESEMSLAVDAKKKTKKKNKQRQHSRIRRAKENASLEASSSSIPASQAKSSKNDAPCRQKMQNESIGKIPTKEERSLKLPFEQARSSSTQEPLGEQDIKSSDHTEDQESAFAWENVFTGCAEVTQYDEGRVILQGVFLKRRQGFDNELASKMSQTKGAPESSSLLENEETVPFKLMITKDSSKTSPNSIKVTYMRRMLTCANFFKWRADSEFDLRCPADRGGTSEC